MYKLKIKYIFRKFLIEEQIDFAIEHKLAFAVDNFVKVSTVKYGYKIISWVASKIKIAQPTRQVFFERDRDAVWDTY